MKTIIVTGANAGIGRECSRQLAALGHRVIMACRNQERGEAARQEIVSQTANQEVLLKIVDLSSLASLKKFVSEITSEYESIDVLINNGADFDISRKQRIVTEEGLESQFTTNVIAPFFLSYSLLPLLEKSPQGKIINISSQGLVMYPFIKLNVTDFHCEKKYNPAKQYYQNKLALLMISLYMKENMKLKTTVHAIRVTNVKVDINRYSNISNFQKKLYAIKSKFSISAAEMAKIYVALASDDNIQGFYIDEKMREVAVNKGARDKAKQIILVKYLSEATGLEAISF
ncbi:MAG: SDR family NAD(P)-dependent oxidoreductase [Bacilli bacterium]|nr:SDR family NAD(P)-dependent oxidoreductase [Bacilli bacterium]